VDVEAIKEEVRSQVIVEVTKKVTHDIMAMLRDQGVHLRSPSNTPSPIDGQRAVVPQPLMQSKETTLTELRQLQIQILWTF
jgi:hypothetical protein